MYNVWRMICHETRHMSLIAKRRHNMKALIYWQEWWATPAPLQVGHPHTTPPGMGDGGGRRGHTPATHYRTHHHSGAMSKIISMTTWRSEEIINNNVAAICMWKIINNIIPYQWYHSVWWRVLLFDIGNTILFCIHWSVLFFVGTIDDILFWPWCYSYSSWWYWRWVLFRWCIPVNIIIRIVFIIIIVIVKCQPTYMIVFSDSSMTIVPVWCVLMIPSDRIWRKKYEMKTSKKENNGERNEKNNGVMK